MHSREHIFKRKSKTKRKHPEIWDSTLSLPLALWRPPGHHLLAFPVVCRALPEPEQAQPSDFTQTLKSDAAPQKSSTALNWETTARRNPSAEQFDVWEKHMLRTQLNACLPPWANERAVDVIRVIAEGCWHGKGFADQSYPQG